MCSNRHNAITWVLRLSTAPLAGAAVHMPPTHLKNSNDVPCPLQQLHALLGGMQECLPCFLRASAGASRRAACRRRAAAGLIFTGRGCQHFRKTGCYLIVKARTLPLVYLPEQSANVHLQGGARAAASRQAGPEGQRAATALAHRLPGARI